MPYETMTDYSTAAASNTSSLLRDVRIYQIDEVTYDAAKLAPLLKQSQSEGYDLADRLDRSLTGMRGFGPLFGAEHDGKIVGICGLQPDPIEEKTLQLRHGYVLPEWRQLGIGSAVLKRVLDAVPADSYSKITLRAYFHPVRKFCEHNGFLPVDHRRYTHERAIN